jgi:glucuronate isomerase
MPASSPPYLHPDRLFSPSAPLRDIAREIYAATEALPIVSPHSHVDPGMLAEDRPFSDPAALFIQPDHYVTRLLHARGVPLSDLGVGRGPLPEPDARRAWRLLCEHWAAFRGTPVRFWLETELAEVFGIDPVLDGECADRLYDDIGERLAQPAFRPRALFERFRIRALATTDDPVDDLAAHRALNDDPGFAGRILPTFRPDRYLESFRPGWTSDVDRLGEVADVDTATYAGWAEAMERRRAYFAAHGATSSDHSHVDARAERLDPHDVARLYADARSGAIGPEDAATLRRHMMFEMARMAADDGLTMTLHPGVHRNHHTPTLDRYGADSGHDIPVAVEFTRALQPVLEAFGTDSRFRLVLFTIDETVFSREVAPLAGFYPSVYAGAPWWFLDAPDAVRRWRAAITESAGFLKTSGFIDDTRAFCSIPARHDMARRLDADGLARLVGEHRLDLSEAIDTAVDLVVGRPAEVFRL